MGHSLGHSLWHAPQPKCPKAANLTLSLPRRERNRRVQAGVALGLARMVGVRFPSWGPQFQTLAVSTIILNLCIGPPLFRSAIIGTGESRAANARKGDVESPPVGVRERLEPRHEGRHEGMHSRDVSKQGSANL